MGSRTWRRQLRNLSVPVASYVIETSIPTALLSMMSWALVFAAMIVFGLAGRAALKMERMTLMVGNCVVVVWEKRGSWLAEVFST